MRILGGLSSGGEVDSIQASPPGSASHRCIVSHPRATLTRACSAAASVSVSGGWARPSHVSAVLSLGCGDAYHRDRSSRRRSAGERTNPAEWIWVRSGQLPPLDAGRRLLLCVSHNYHIRMRKCEFRAVDPSFPAGTSRGSTRRGSDDAPWMELWPCIPRECLEP